MNREALEQSWAATRQHFQDAIAHLPAELVPGKEGATLSSFKDWLDHDELELALDDLADVGISNNPPPEFWRCLTQAAVNMGLHDRISIYQHKVNPINEA